MSVHSLCPRYYISRIHGKTFEGVLREKTRPISNKPGDVASLCLADVDIKHALRHYIDEHKVGRNIEFNGLDFSVSTKNDVIKTPYVEIDTFGLVDNISFVNCRFHYTNLIFKRAVSVSFTHCVMPKTVISYSIMDSIEFDACNDKDVIFCRCAFNQKEVRHTRILSFWNLVRLSLQ